MKALKIVEMLWESVLLMLVALAGILLYNKWHGRYSTLTIVVMASSVGSLAQYVFQFCFRRLHQKLILRWIEQHPNDAAKTLFISHYTPAADEDKTPKS
jgi:membrane protein YqaA with SNARE-associated domain